MSEPSREAVERVVADAIWDVAKQIGPGEHATRLKEISDEVRHLLGPALQAQAKAEAIAEMAERIGKPAGSIRTVDVILSVEKERRERKLREQLESDEFGVKLEGLLIDLERAPSSAAADRVAVFVRDFILEDGDGTDPVSEQREPRDEAIDRTPRGFADYAEFVDSYGHKITVRQSSAVTEDAVWIFCAKAPHGPDAPTPHLNIKQARKLRDGLDRFLREMDDGSET